MSAASPEPVNDHSLQKKLEKIGVALGIAGAVWFALVAAWGMFGVLGGGHYSAAASAAISAENMLDWHTLGRYWDYTLTKPEPRDYYCHHPVGLSWMYVPMVVIFGHHDWVVFLAPVAMSMATGFLLYALGKQLWGVVGGVAAIIGFSTMPIALGYSNFQNTEVITIFGWVLFFWGHARMLVTWRRRFMIASVIGALITAHGDWEGYIATGCLAGWSFFRFYVLPKRWTPRVQPFRYGQWWAFTVAVSVVSLFFLLGLFQHWGKIADLFSSAEHRSAAASPLRDLLQARAARIDLMFIPLGITVGKIALPISVARFVIKRSDGEFYTIAAFLAALIHYVAFPNGADVHVFWPHYFAAYFALAFAQLTVTIASFAGWIVRWFRARSAETTKLSVGLAFACIFFVAMLPDDLRILKYGRATWGRYNEEKIRMDTDHVRVLHLLRKRAPAKTTYAVHSSLNWGWEAAWAAKAPHRGAGSIGTSLDRSDADLNPFIVGRISSMSAAELKKWAGEYKLEIYDDIVVIDKRAGKGNLEAYTFEESDPNVFQWYLFANIEPVKTLRHDPFATWEWRKHLDQPADLPTEAPRTANDKRIARNIAFATGDMARVSQLETELIGLLDQGARVKFESWLELLGIRHIKGTNERIETWFAARGPAEGEWVFGLRAKMIGKNKWSWLPPDTLDRDVGSFMPMPSQLWKDGFWYRQSMSIFHRIGDEQYYGVLWSRDSTKAPYPAGKPDKNFDLLLVR